MLNDPRHCPVFRKGSGKCAVLFVHGILGTPDHFRDFFPLVPSDWGVNALLLDGHGKTAREFAQASMTRWRRQAARAAASLCAQYDSVMVCAHSMGTLFAIEQALIQPKIKALFLLDVPLYPAPKPAAVTTSLKVSLGYVREDDVWARAARSCFGITPERKLWRYAAWLPRYIELFAQMELVRPKLSELSVRTVAFQAAKDELVARRATLQ
ncbi:MAG: alpha/beta hydrolase, partial [Oscillospiraceae bacterium]